MENDIHDDDPRCLVGTLARWTRRKDARPGEILDAALDLFVERGFAATKMEHIAKRCGVTAGTLYRYYASKEEILRAVIHDSFTESLVEGEQIVSEFTGTGPELLDLVVRTWWSRMGETRLSGIPKLMIAESANFPELSRFHRDEIIARADALIGRAIRYGIERGEFRAIDVDVAVKVVTAPVVMAMLWKHTDSCTTEAFDIARYLDEVIATLINGLARPAAGESK